MNNSKQMYRRIQVSDENYERLNEKRINQFEPLNDVVSRLLDYSNLIMPPVPKVGAMNSKLKVAILNDYFIQGTPHAVLVEKYSITKEELDNLIYLIESNLA